MTGGFRNKGHGTGLNYREFVGRLPGSHLASRGGPSSRLPSVLIDLAAGRNVPGATIDERAVKLANEHRLTGLLWTWAREHVEDTALKTELAQNDLYVQAHLVQIWKVLQESVARLKDAEIDVATIKGVTAEARWYERRGERPCSDLDLLLSPVQLDRATDAVRLLEPDHPWLPHIPSLIANGRIQTVTTHVDNLEVDLHLDLLKLGIPTRQSREVWNHTQLFRLPRGGSVRVLDDTIALMHFLVHLNKDRFQRLLGYADVARIMARGHVDWERAERFTRGEGIRASTFRTLEVVLDQLSLPWPDELDRPGGPRVRVWNVIWHPGIRLRGIEGRLRYRRRQDWVAFLARGRTIEAFRWWIREMWPPAPVVDVRYGEIQGPYLWKLFMGRFLTSRAKRVMLAEQAARSKGPSSTS